MSAFVTTIHFVDPIIPNFQKHVVHLTGPSPWTLQISKFWEMESEKKKSIVLSVRILDVRGKFLRALVLIILGTGMEFKTENLGP